MGAKVAGESTDSTARSSSLIDDADNPVWSSRQIAEIPAVDGHDHLLVLSDETLLYWAKYRHQTMTILRIDPKTQKHTAVECPLSDPCWMVRVATDSILVAQGADTEREQRGSFVLWNPVMHTTQRVDGEPPNAATPAWDRLGDQIYMITNARFAASSAGFDCVMDHTQFGIFDVTSGQFSTPFHRVADTDARQLVVQNQGDIIVFGYGRANCFIDLVQPNFRPVSAHKENQGFNFDLTHSYGARCIGADSRRALLVVGDNGDNDQAECALMRWTRDQGCFEVIGRWVGMYYRCSTMLSDGSTLIFCRQRTTNTIHILKHAPGSKLAFVGRLEGIPVHTAVQSENGAVFIKSNQSVHQIHPPSWSSHA